MRDAGPEKAFGRMLMEAMLILAEPAEVLSTQSPAEPDDCPL